MAHGATAWGKRDRALRGVSSLALLAGFGIATQASAQAVPGSAQCPVVAGIVTCSGALPNGVAVPVGPYDGLTVRDVTGDMAATNRAVVSYRTDRPTTRIVLDDSDLALRALFTDLSGASRQIGIVDILTSANTSFSLVSNVDLFMTEQVNTAGNTVRTAPVGLWIRGAGGTFDIANAGDITMRQQFVTTGSAAIQVDTIAASAVNVVNSGTIAATNIDHGIIVSPNNARINILNSGLLRMSGNVSGDAIFIGVGTGAPVDPIFVQPTNRMTNVDYTIVNDGTIDASAGNVRSVISFDDVTNSGRQGIATGRVVNKGTILASPTAFYVINVLHPGARTVINNGLIEAVGSNRGAIGIRIDEVTSNPAAATTASTTLIENGLAGRLRISGIGAAGIVTDGNTVIRNAGEIVIDGKTGSALGIQIADAQAELTATRIENSGLIRVTGVTETVVDSFTKETFTISPIAIALLTGVDETRPGANISVVNSGTIEALGAGALGMDFQVGAGSDVRQGRVSLDLSASSIVRGGSGAGAAIRFAGGERHGVVNAGLITAASGSAIVGGDAAETITNSGRIEGSVALAASADAVVNRAGGVVTGAVDLGAGDDTLENGGRLEGGVTLGDGNDRLTILAGGVLVGVRPPGTTSLLALTTGAGDDIVDIAGSVAGGIRLEGGNDTLITRAGASIDGGTGSGALLTLAGDGRHDVTLAANTFRGFINAPASGASTIRINGPQQLTGIFTAAESTLIFGGTTDWTLDGNELTSFGTFIKEGPASLAIDGVPNVLNGVRVNDGTLRLTEFLPTSATVNGGVLEVMKGITQSATINAGSLSPGGSGVGSIRLAALSMSEAGRLRFDLGAPGQVGGADNDLITVTGNLTLDGLLDINARPSFGSGVYRLINYGGALTDRGLTIGNAPVATYQVQTAVAGQVNLLVGPIVDLSMQFWDGGDTVPDGVIDGGSGVWNTLTTNWTDPTGTANAAWASGMAVFQGAPGTVTIAPEGVSAAGVQFAAGGYTIDGGPLTLTGARAIRVGDGSAGGAGYTATIAAAIRGTGGIDKTDLGTLILSGSNSYTGGTRIGGGVVRVASDGNLGATGASVTLDGGALQFGAAGSSARGFTIGGAGGRIDAGNALTLSGAIDGAGALTKSGGGTLTLTGNSSAYAGTFTVAGGAVALNGSLGGGFTVQNGARLLGTGTLANLTVASGGILAPGNSIGTMNVTGNAVFRSGSFYDLEIAATGAGDRLAVGGTATIEGGTVRVTALDPETQYTTGTRYTFLTAAGGRTGTFAGLSETSAFLDFVLGYDATSAFLTVNVVRTFPDVAQTFNQRQSSTGLAAFAQTPGSDSLAVYNALLLTDAGTARTAFDVSSGEIYADLLGDTLGSGMARADRLVSRAHAPAADGWGLWGGLDGRTGRIDGDGNAARIEHSDYGFELGIDYRGSNNAWAMGAGGGYVHASLDLDARASRSRSTGWQVGGYARYGTGGTGLTASVAASYQHRDADVTRRIAFAGIDRVADGRASVAGTAVTGEARYGMAVAYGWSLGPVASVHYAHAKIDDIRELGPTALALSGRGTDDRTRYGGGAFVNWQSGRGSVDLSAQYIGGDSNPTDVALEFAGSPANAFDIRAPRVRGSAALLDLGARYELGGGWSLAGNARATSNQDQRTISANATLGWRF